MKRLSITISFVMLCAKIICAEDFNGVNFEQDGIAYRTTSDSTCTVIQLSPYSTTSPGGYKGDIVIPETVIYKKSNYTVTKISPSAFSHRNITSVSLPNSIETIGRYAFMGCYTLTSIDIPNSVTKIEQGAFFQCTSLDSIDFPDSVLEIEPFAFYNCTGLKSVRLSESLSSIPESCFFGCTSLTKISIPKKVSIIHKKAFSYSGISEINISESIGKIYRGAFAGCENLKAITVADNNLNYTAVNGVLYNNDLSELIQYPAGKIEQTFEFHETTATIGCEAFEGCNNLVYLTIPNSVEVIGEEAFYFCRNLTHITLPVGVKEIGERAFCNCLKLSNITYLSADPIEGAYNAFLYIDSNATLNYLAEAEVKIDSTIPWKYIDNRVGRDADFVASLAEVSGGKRADGALYDLQGRRVANPRRGLYIQNGRKVIKK